LVAEIEPMIVDDDIKDALMLLPNICDEFNPSDTTDLLTYNPP
jgi:hypothetical protein